MGRQNDKQNDKVNSQTLEMKAKSVLNDISNQQQQSMPINWEKKTSRYEKNNRRYLKLPRLQQVKKGTMIQYKKLPSLLHKKNKQYKQKMDSLINAIHNSSYNQANFDECNYNLLNEQNCNQKNNQNKLIPDYYFNKLHQYTFQNQQDTSNSSVLSKFDKRKINKSYTQNSQSNQNIDLYFKSKQKHHQQLKKDFSVHVRRALFGINKINLINKKQVDQIKSLIHDKRIQCRKLSKQGLLIMKRDNTNSINQNYANCIKSMQLKHKSIQRIRSIQTNRYKQSLPKTSMSNHSIQQIKQKSNPSTFLKNALQILHIKNSPNTNQFKKSLLVRSTCIQ